MNNQYANLHKVWVLNLYKTQIYIFWTQKSLTLGLRFDTIIVLGGLAAAQFFVALVNMISLWYTILYIKQRRDYRGV